MHVNVVELTTTTFPHATPSMIMLFVVPKLVPVIVITVPPILGPNLGTTWVIVDVLLCLYVIAFEIMTSVALLITTSHCLSVVEVTGNVENMIPLI